MTPSAIRSAAIAGLALGLAACAAQPPVRNAPIYYGQGGLPFSEAVKVGDMLYLSGQIGVRPGENKLVEGGIEAEARQTMENIGAVLERRGLSFDDIVKCTVMLADMRDWPRFNEVYLRYFKPGRAARAQRLRLLGFGL